MGFSLRQRFQRCDGVLYLGRVAGANRELALSAPVPRIDVVPQRISDQLAAAAELFLGDAIHFWKETVPNGNHHLPCPSPYTYVDIIPNECTPSTGSLPGAARCRALSLARQATKRARLVTGRYHIGSETGANHLGGGSRRAIPRLSRSLNTLTRGQCRCIV